MKTSSRPAIAAFPNSASPRLVVAPPPRDARPGEVICRTLHLGICGTDREVIESQHPAVPAGEDYLILGHECLAEVVAVGAGVSQFQVGELVVPAVRRPVAGVSAERIDLRPFDNSFVERGILREHGFSAPFWLDRPEYLHPVPSSLRDLAVLAEPLAVIEKAIHEALLVQRGRLGADAWTTPPPRMLVTGMGPIAFAGVLAARVRGWPIAILGRDAADSPRARLAMELGAEYRSTRGDWKPSDAERGGWDFFIECTGNEELTVAAGEAIRGCGVMVWLGAPREPAATSVNLGRLMRDVLCRNQIILGSVNAAPRDFAAALAHLERLRNDCGDSVRRLITARVRPEDAIPQLLERANQSVKTVLMYE